MDKTTGKNRYAIRFVADEIQFVGGRREDSDTDKREADRAGKRDQRDGGSQPPADDDRPPYNDEDAAREARDTAAAREQFANSSVGRPETGASTSVKK